MRIPHPGELNTRVEIGVTMNTVGENGYPACTDSIVATVWAGVEDGASKWFYAADSDVARRGISFIIRWRQDVRPGMWIRFRGVRYLITEIGEYDFRRRYMRLVTQAQEGVAP